MSGMKGVPILVCGLVLIFGGGALISSLTDISAPLAMMLIAFVFGTVSGVTLLHSRTH
jgi:hypothetical protein